jgi:1-acyl-sn-glycerol-3-phosphate acyltransferase
MNVRAPLRAVAAGGLSGALLTLLAVEERLAGATDERRERYARTWARSLISILRVDVRLDGDPQQLGDHGSRARLVVANHRSTIDILLMLHLFGGQLLARGDMATWPLIGVLARSVGTLFVDRDDPTSGAGAVQRMRTRMRAGVTIGVFPEGTTFPGDEVRPFQAGAFVAITREKGIVLPVGIAYEREDAIYGDEPIAEHLQRLAAASRTSVGVAIGTPVSTTGSGVATLAERAHDEVQRLVYRARSMIGRPRP